MMQAYQLYNDTPSTEHSELLKTVALLQNHTMEGQVRCPMLGIQNGNRHCL